MKYFQDCHHLDCDDIESSDCLKRYYNILDPIRKERYRLAVCNDHLRLRIIRKKNDYNFEHYPDSSIYNEVIKDIVSEHLDLKLNRYPSEEFQQNKPIYLSIPICGRPYIMYTENIFTAMQRWINVTDYLRLYGEDYAVMSSIKNRLCQVLSVMNNQMKFKKDFHRIGVLSRKLSGFSSQMDLDDLMSFKDILMKYKFNKY